MSAVLRILIIYTLPCLEILSRATLVFELDPVVIADYKPFQTIHARTVVDKIVEFANTHIVADTDRAKTRIVFPPHLVDPADGAIGNVFERHRYDDLMLVVETYAILDVIIAVLCNALQICFFGRLMPAKIAKWVLVTAAESRHSGKQLSGCEPSGCQENTNSNGYMQHRIGKQSGKQSRAQD